MQKPNEKIVHGFIVKAKKGDHEAYTQLVNHTIEYVKWLVSKKINNHNDIEDVTIDIYTKLWRELHKFDEAREFLPWFHTMIDHHCNNKKRQYTRINEHDTVMDLAEMSDLLPDEKTDIQLGLEIKETREQLSELLDRMKEKYRDILTRYYYKDQKLKAIGEAYGISESAASRRLKTAEKHLKKLLLEEEKRGNKIYSVVFSSVLLRLFEQQTEGVPPISPEESARIIEAVSQGIQVEAMVTAATASTATGATSTGGASTAGATAATTTAATGTAASTTAGGLGAKIMAFNLAQQIAVGTCVVAVAATAIGVPTYNYMENQKTVAAMVVIQEQEEQARLEEQLAAEQEQSRIAEEEAAQQAAVEESAPAAEEPEQAAIAVPATEATEDTAPNGTPEIDMGDMPGGSTSAPERGVNTAEETLRSTNPYVGQSEPAGGCPNSTVENPRWDSSVGGWRGTSYGSPVIVDPYGGVWPLD